MVTSLLITQITAVVPRGTLHGSALGLYAKSPAATRISSPDAASIDRPLYGFAREGGPAALAHVGAIGRYPEDAAAMLGQGMGGRGYEGPQTTRDNNKREKGAADLRRPVALLVLVGLISYSLESPEVQERLALFAGDEEQSALRQVARCGELSESGRAQHSHDALCVWHPPI